MQKFHNFENEYQMMVSMSDADISTEWCIFNKCILEFKIFQRNTRSVVKWFISTVKVFIDESVNM